MSKAQEGQTVHVRYSGHLEDGTEFDSNRERDPLRFIIGGGQVIPGFDLAVRELAIGEQRRFTLPPEQAYGEHREDMLITLDRAQFPTDEALEIGTSVYLQAGNQPLPATIIAIDDDQITLDANHRLAGQTLIFDIELLAIT